MKYSIVLFLGILLLCSTVHGLSLSIPLVREFTFEPGKVIAVDLAVQNNDGIAQRIELFANGDLSEFVSFEPKTAVTLDPGDVYAFKATLVLPQEIDPGMHVPKIGAKIIPSEGASMIGATTAVQVRLFIRGRYEGEFVKSTLEAQPRSVGEDVQIRLTHQNLGTKDIGEVAAQVKVFEQSGSLIDTIGFPEVALLKDEKKTVTGVFSTEGLNSGAYSANATIMVGGKPQTEQPSVIIRLGEEDIEVSGHTTQLQRGDMRPFMINVTNRWNEPLKFVHAKVKMDRGDELGFAEFTTPSVTIAPFQTVPLQGYVDLKNASLGSVQADAVIYFSGAEKTREVQLPVVIVEQGDDGSRMFSYDMVTLLVGIIILLIVLNLFWFAYVQGELKRR